MSREDKYRNIALALVIIIAGIMGIMNGSYLLSAMYIATIIGALFIIRNKDLYNMLYAVLLVSVIYDYVLYVPGIESVYMFHIVLGVFTLISLYKVFTEREVLLKLDKKVLGIFIIWFIYMCVSLLWAINRSLSIKYIAIYMMMFAFIGCLMAYNINKERLNETIKLLLYLISIVVVIGLIEVLLGKQLPVKHYIDGFLDSLPQWQINTIQARPIVFSYNTNNLNATLAMLIPICLFAVYKFKSVIAKIWFSLVSIIAFALVVITTSRTGYAAFLAAAAIFILYSLINVRNLGIKQMVYPLLIVVGMTAAFFYAPEMMNIKPVEGEEIQHTTTLTGKLHSLESMVSGEETSEYSTLNRMAIIKDVFGGVIGEKRLQGFGVGNVEQYIKDQGNTGSIYSPHCYAIEILGDFGIPGVVLYGILYLYLLIYNLVLAVKKRSSVCFAMVTALIAFAPASFGPSSITYVFSYWIMMGLSISCIQIYKDSNSEYMRTSEMKEYKLV